MYDIIFLISDINFPCDSNFKDIISYERYDLGKKIENPYLVPTYVYTCGSKSGYSYLFTNPETDVSAELDGDIYFNTLDRDIDSLNSIIARCKFKTNKDFFESIYQLKKEVKEIYKYHAYSQNPVMKETDVKRDGIIIDKIIFKSFGEDIVSRNNEMYHWDHDLAEQYKNAVKIKEIGYLWHPVQYVYYLKNKSAKH